MNALPKIEVEVVRSVLVMLCAAAFVALAGCATPSSSKPAEPAATPAPSSGSAAPAAASAAKAPANAVQAPASQQPVSTGSTAKISPEQLDSLVAPIALYPDPLLAQTLAAATYPLEVIQLQQWLEKNPTLKDQALADAVAKQPWDPSVQSMAALPEVVKRLADNIQWTADLGNAFLAQQSEVMDAVQRMRKKAEEKGNLKSTEQQTVQTQTAESKQVIVIEQANPQVVYVPAYDPVVVYGAPIYPYPPIYYPPYPYGGVAVAFGVGIAMGAFWGGGWGYSCGWHGGYSNVNVNVNNRFNRNVNVNNPGRGNAWQHDARHRGGTPYGDRATADRFGGSARGDSMSQRQTGAREQVGRQGGEVSSARGDLGDRSAGGSGDRTAGGGERGGAGNNRASGGGGAGAGGGRASGGDQIGGRDFSRDGGGSNPGAFGGESRGYNGSHSRAASSRGASSRGAARGGGGARRR